MKDRPDYVDEVEVLEVDDEFFGLTVAAPTKREAIAKMNEHGASKGQIKAGGVRRMHAFVDADGGLHVIHIDDLQPVWTWSPQFGE